MSESVSPNARNCPCSGVTSMTAGNICATRSPVSTALFPENSNRESASAAPVATTRARGTAISATTMLLRRNVRKSVPVTNSAYASRVRRRGTSVEPAAARSSAGVRLVTNMTT
jgi:hypothetical protein